MKGKEKGKGKGKRKRKRKEEREGEEKALRNTPWQSVRMYQRDMNVDQNQGFHFPVRFKPRD